MHPPGIGMIRHPVQLTNAKRVHGALDQHKQTATSVNHYFYALHPPHRCANQTLMYTVSAAKQLITTSVTLTDES